MNRSLMTLMISLIFVSPTLFAGATVSVWKSGSRTYMQAVMTANYNGEDSGSAYVGANGYLGQVAMFFARDSQGDYFSCYVQPSSDLYEQAVDIKNNFTNGGRLYGYREDGSNDCVLLSLGNYSYNLE